MPWPWPWSWILGFVTGTVGALCLLCFVFFKQIILPKLSKPLPRKRRPPPVQPYFLPQPHTPSDRPDRAQSASTSKDASETAAWFNSTIDWLFSVMQPSPALRLGFFADSFADSVLDLKRTFLAYLLRDAALVSVATGNALPSITSLRILRWEEEDEDKELPFSSLLSGSSPSMPFVAVTKLRYEGGVGAVVRFDPVGGIFPSIWISERLMALEGTLYVCCLDKVIYYGFAPPLDCLHMDGEICIGNSRWPRLSKLMARYLFPWLFRRKWVMPAMKSKWLYDRPPVPSSEATRIPGEDGVS